MSKVSGTVERKKNVRCVVQLFKTAAWSRDCVFYYSDLARIWIVGAC